MPYVGENQEGYNDHHVQSPLAMIDRTCQTCHRETEETLRQDVYDRQTKVTEIREQLETELAKAHIEAKFAWDRGATEKQMEQVLKLIRQAQWRWDFCVASHGASFHAPQDIQAMFPYRMFLRKKKHRSISVSICKPKMKLKKLF